MNETSGGTGLSASNIFIDAANGKVRVFSPAFSNFPDAITTPGTFTFNILVTDALGNTLGTAHTIVINPAPIRFIPVTPAPNLAQGTVGAAYSRTVTAIGGTGNKTLSYTLAPPTALTDLGLLISPASGTANANAFTITGSNAGKPVTAGSATINVMATDSIGVQGTTAAPFVITINPVLSISPASLAQATDGTPSNQTITVSGGTPKPYPTFTVTGISAGTTGLTAGDLVANASTGTVTFNKSFMFGTASFTVNVIDTAGATLTKAYTLTVNKQLVISPPTLPAGDAGVSYTPPVTVTQGTQNYTSLTVSNYNAGGTGMPVPTTNALTGVVSFGSATSAGSISFRVNVTDLAGATAFRDYTIQINPALNFTPAPPDLIGGDINQALSRVITVHDGTPGYTTTISPLTALLNLTLTKSTVTNANDTITLAGTPNGTGTVSFQVTVTDQVSGASLSSQFDIAIKPQPTFSPVALPATDVGVHYGEVITVVNGTAPFTTLTVTGFNDGGTGLERADGGRNCGRVGNRHVHLQQHADGFRHRHLHGECHGHGGCLEVAGVFGRGQPGAHVYVDAGDDGCRRSVSKNDHGQ